MAGKKKTTSLLVVFLLCIAVITSFTSCGSGTEYEGVTQADSIVELSTESTSAYVTEEETSTTEETTGATTTKKAESTGKIPEYSGKAFVALNGNKPVFSKSELSEKGYEKYSSLDSLGRCGVVIASLGKDTMPKKDEERGSISHVKPSGWVQATYEHISGKYLYNRCHLIGWQLSAENDNKRNLITGTKYFNINGMLPFENMVADYIRETNNHVAYRVTPVYDGKGLVAKGVQIEAKSVEDNGDGICFNVFCYNVQPGVKINYKTGESTLEGGKKPANITTKKAEENSATGTYVLNINSKKIHYPDCRYVKSMKDENKQSFKGNIKTLYDKGYTTCGNCF